MSDQANDIFEMSDSDFISKFGSGDSIDSGNTDDTHEPQDISDDTSVGNHADDTVGYSDYSDSGYSDSDYAEEEEYYDPEIITEEYKRIVGAPIKGAGKEVTLGSTDEAIKLIQMGMGYHKSMEQMKPHKKAIAMLERNNMLDEDKLNFAIDLMNKNPQAIKKLIADSGVDLYEYNSEDGDSLTYVPNDYKVSENELAIQQAIKDIEATPTYQRTIGILGSEWDEQSREIIKSNPSLISLINDQVESGIYDAVNKEVDRLKMLGEIPIGMPDIEAYKYAGNALYANNSNTNSAPEHVDGQQDSYAVANARSPIIPPRKNTVRQKRATNVPRNSGRATAGRPNIEDVWNMSDEDFVKQFGLF